MVDGIVWWFDAKKAHCLLEYKNNSVVGPRSPPERGQGKTIQTWMSEHSILPEQGKEGLCWDPISETDADSWYCFDCWVLSQCSTKFCFTIYMHHTIPPKSFQKGIPGVWAI